MKSVTSNVGQSPSHLATGYPWSDLPPSSTVQDLAEVIEGAKLHDHTDAGVRKRVRFEIHDFLTEQKTQGDVFLLRWILHDWPDQYVIRILRNLRPALKPGNKIVVNDQVMPEPGQVSTVVERQIR